MDKIAYTCLEKRGDNIYHFDVDSVGSKVNERVYGILYFLDRWGEKEGGVVLDILDREGRLKL